MTLKADLYNPGGEVFRKLSSCLVSENGAFRELNFAATAAPLGGSWKDAPGVLIKISATEFSSAKLALGREIALRRSDFPLLDGEIYLCDLFNADVEDSGGTRVGKIVGFSGSDLAVNLQVHGTQGQSFEFPLAWVDFDDSSIADGRLRVPDIEAWMELK